MLVVKEWIIASVTADPTLSTLLKNADNTTINFYPQDIDIDPENFPAVTFQDVGDEILSDVPAHIGIIQLDIWSIIDALQAEDIYTALQNLFNRQQQITSAVTFEGILFWIKQTSTRDLHSPSRRIWRKQMDLKYWMIRSNNK